MTVILMPATAVDDRESELANGIYARIVSLSGGSIAVMSTDAAAVDQLTMLDRESILPTAGNGARPGPSGKPARRSWKRWSGWIEN